MTYFRPNIDAMSGYAPGLQPAGGEIIKLNTNENPYPPSPKAVEAIGALEPERLRKYPPAMAEAFREAAARLNGVPAHSILCTNGGDDLLTIAVRAFCDKTRPLAYPTPTYSLYPVLAEIQDCPVVELEFDQDYNLPAGLADTGAALTIVCNPNAPSGSFIVPELLDGLAAKLEGKGVLLIDEAYVDFAESSCVELTQTNNNVIILRSMSKGYSLAGLRFGYAIASKALIDGLAKVKDSYNVDALAIAAATAAIKDQDYFQKNVEAVKTQRQRLTAALKDLGFEVPSSNSNFVLARSVERDAKAIYNELAGRGIYVRYFSLPRLTDKIRVTVGTPKQNDALLEALQEILKKS